VREHTFAGAKPALLRVIAALLAGAFHAMFLPKERHRCMQET
jgi:hypothetical protein